MIKTLITNQIKQDHIKKYKRLFKEGIPFLTKCDFHYPDKVKLKSKYLTFLPINYKKLSNYQQMLLLNKVENNEEKVRKLLGKDKKVIIDFYDKERYVIHYEMLDFYLNQGIIVTKVHKIITFNESD